MLGWLLNIWGQGKEVLTYKKGLHSLCLQSKFCWGVVWERGPGLDPYLSYLLLRGTSWTVHHVIERHPWLNADVVSTGLAFYSRSTTSNKCWLVAPPGGGGRWCRFWFRWLSIVLVESKTFVTQPCIVGLVSSTPTGCYGHNFISKQPCLRLAIS